MPQDEFQGLDLFAGPILHVLCPSRAAFLEPVTIQLPLSLGNKLVNIPDPSVCRVRVFFLSSEQETKEWIEISNELEHPASYDGKFIKFKVRHFSRYVDKMLQNLKGFSIVCWSFPRFGREGRDYGDQGDLVPFLLYGYDYYY